MPAKKAITPQTTESVSLISSDSTKPKPRLSKLTIKNFRCIGSNPVEIDLDDIVVLVGPNNVGKSSILKAYEVVMSQGSTKGKLDIDDFPNRMIDTDNLPEIQLETIIYENTPGSQWVEILDSGEILIKERWKWNNVGDPKREGWDVTEKKWSDKVPWGAPNVANTRRPEPHRVNAFDSPEDQADSIKKLLKQALEDRVKNLKSPKLGEENDYTKLLTQVKELQKKIVSESKEQINEVNSELTSLLEKVFPNYIVDFDAKPEDNLDKTINLFKEEAQLLVGPKGGHLSTLDRQGSGARRTLLWTALKFISENNRKTKSGDLSERPHVLLIDEPEMCLHPSAIRDACDVLYNLPAGGNWQVVVTTHSPVFIDFSRDNTTIVRVEKEISGNVKSTTVFRPIKANLDDNDKTNLKLLNLCDPHVAEFFFGGQTIIVEGDTEYTAFNHVIQTVPGKYKNIHIIRARGKATIVSLIKILNHFGSPYSILHDSDFPKITKKDGTEQTNGAWTINSSILNQVLLKPENVKTRLIASLPNFEKAYFDEEITDGKPYHALLRIKEDESKLKLIESLLDSLTDHSKQLPAGCIEWSSIEELENQVK